MEIPALQLQKLFNVHTLLLNAGIKSWGVDSILAIVLCECRSGPSGFLNKSGLLTEHEEPSECWGPLSKAGFICCSLGFLGGLIHLIITVFCKHFNQLLILISSFTLAN